MQEGPTSIQINTHTHGQILLCTTLVDFDGATQGRQNLAQNTHTPEERLYKADTKGSWNSVFQSSYRNRGGLAG